MAVFDDVSPFRAIRDPRDPSRVIYTRGDKYEEPTFCAAITEDEIERAHNAIKDGRYDDPVFTWNPSRHVGAKNPTQCEAARRNDLLSDRWYREPGASLLKNIGAGIVNAIIPGSDLGDAGSSTQIVGMAIGAVAGMFINPAGIVQTANTAMNLGVIGKAMTGIANFAMNPIGQLAVGVIGNALMPKTVSVPQGVVAQATIPPFTTGLQNISGTQGTKISNAAFGFSPAPGSSSSTTPEPWYKTTAAIVAGSVLGGFVLLWFLFKMLKKR